MINKELKAIILSEYAKGNVCFMGPENVQSAKMDEFISQPVEGILYDLNRSEPVVLTFIGDPKWVNDYAVCKTIRALKEKIDTAPAIRWVKASERTPQKELNCPLRLNNKHYRTGYYFEGSGSKGFVISPGMNCSNADESQFDKIEWLEEI